MKVYVVSELSGLPEQIRDEFDDSFFDESRSVLVIDYGTRIQYHTDGGEPEDNYFFRDWSWVESAINAAYEAGKAES